MLFPNEGSPISLCEPRVIIIDEPFCNEIRATLLQAVLAKVGVECVIVDTHSFNDLSVMARNAINNFVTEPPIVYQDLYSREQFECYNPTNHSLHREFGWYHQFNKPNGKCNQYRGQKI